MKKQLIIWMLACCMFFPLIAQNIQFTEQFRKQYEGKWSANTKHQINTIDIKFEKGKTYATIIDNGSGEAPPIILQAFYKNNKLIIQPAIHHHDYCELEVKNGLLIFHTQPTIWGADGKPKPPGKYFGERVFVRVKAANG